VKRDGRIFVTNYSGYDLESALDYTTLNEDEAFVNITEGKVNIFATEQLKYQIREVLEEEGFCEDDMLLISGSAVISSLAIVEGLRYVDPVEVLIYNHITGAYAKRELRGEG